jgi:branched-chain amino acid transport system substrate-binding protein
MLKNVIERAGDNLTRDNVLKLAKNMPEMTIPLLLPGVTIKGSPELSRMRIVRFDGKSWVQISEVMSATE